jgi:hypothetical protein
MHTYPTPSNLLIPKNLFIYSCKVSNFDEITHAAGIDMVKEVDFTLSTDGYGDSGLEGVISVSQGANFCLANVACYENEKANIRLNEG